MGLPISGCYYHSGRLAVATCARCGVGICKACAVKDEHGTILCYRCGNEKLKQQHREHRKSLKEGGGRFSRGVEFILPGIIGLLIAAVGIIGLRYTGGVSLNEGSLVSSAVYILIAYMLFSIPFCYTVLCDLFAPKYDTFNNHFGRWYFKVIISLVGGWLVFSFVLIRFIARKLGRKKQ